LDTNPKFGHFGAFTTLNVQWEVWCSREHNPPPPRLDLMRFIDHSDDPRQTFGTLVIKKTCTLIVCDVDPVHV